MNVLLSIKPEYVKEIKKGEKKYEFRKSVFRVIETFERVFIYSSSPVKKIVGSFSTGQIVEEHPIKLWEQFHDVAGITKEDFFKYFEKREKGFAISIENLEFFKKPVNPLKIKPDFFPPQSFCYITEEFIDKILKNNLEDMYESGYSLRMFEILEDNLVNFLKYIPAEYCNFDQRKKIYSPVLNDLLIRIGCQIDLFFRNWEIIQKLNSNIEFEDLKISNYIKIDTDKEMTKKQKYALGDKQIILSPTEEVKIPFKKWSKWKPESNNWWNAYNNVKHHGYEYIEEGNLYNVIESLAALFLLNCLHDEVKFKLIKYGYIEKDSELRNQMNNRYMLNLNGYRVTSKLFEYEY
ncbi:MAG TPA: hypothetical protein VFE71_00425 [Bacteroidales bacterium]|nr:hypothetical protein [Bacteroidales bacterium]